MKVFIEYELNNTSGKGKFISRLCRQWDVDGIKYSDSPNGCDVRLAITKFRTECKLPTVLRIDGAHNEYGRDQKSLDWKNNIVSYCIKKSSAVIWQSDFCRKMGHKVFKNRPKKEYVIFNGANPSDYHREPNTTETKHIIMSAKWVNRPHKRLKEMLEISEAYHASHENVIFHLVGSHEQRVPRGVVDHGQVDEEELRELLGYCDCMLNLAYYDWCPNAVVEALVAGLPVICANGTGVAEIVKDCGVVLDLDKHDHDVMRKEKPPEFSFAKVFYALDDVLCGTFPKAEHLYIERIAKKYEEVLRGCL